MKHRSRSLVVALSLILAAILFAAFIVVFFWIAKDGFLMVKSDDERAMVASAMKEVQEAMVSDPVEGWREGDTLFYFKPRSYEGRITGKTLEASVLGSRLCPAGGEVAVGVKKQNYFNDGPSDVMLDKVTLDMAKDEDGRWRVSGVDVRP